MLFPHTTDKETTIENRVPHFLLLFVTTIYPEGRRFYHVFRLVYQNILLA